MVTPLDAAKALASRQLLDGYGVWCHLCQTSHDAACAACGAADHIHGHAEDCPVPMLPQIVKALERLARIDRSPDED